MKKLQLPFLAVITLLLSGCWPHKHDSIVVCDIPDGEEYVIRWDVFPEPHEELKIYISTSPDNFDLNSEPYLRVSAKDGVVELLTPNSKERYYFLLNFNDCFHRVVGARSAYVQSAYSFRDIGGYSTEDEKYTRYGKVFRTGLLDTISDADAERIRFIAPKTIVEFRNPEDCKYDKDRLNAEKIVYFPLGKFDVEALKTRVYAEEFKRDEARETLKNFYFSLLNDECNEKFSQFIDLFTDEANYPILITSDYGKGYSDIASLYLFSALGLNIDEVYEDYTASNQYFCKTQLVQKVGYLNQDTREAVASIIHNNRKDLANIVYSIQENYESVENYMIQEIGITNDKKSKIREILLTDK